MSTFDKFNCTITQWDQFFISHVYPDPVYELPWPEACASSISVDFRKMLQRLGYTPQMAATAGNVFDCMCGTGLTGSVLSSTATIVLAMSWMVRNHPEIGVQQLEHLLAEISPR